MSLTLPAATVYRVFYPDGRPYVMAGLTVFPRSAADSAACRIAGYVRCELAS